ncbi:MAG: YitT family protein [Oscillospiraceae bacterium]|nr:YitT family protein [Oscillospiraceae bacterium]
MTARKSNYISALLRGITLRGCAVVLLGSAILAFGLYHIHAQTAVTEGGVLGMTLLLDHWFSISPSVSNFVISAICYLIGWRVLGRTFLIYSGVSAVGFSAVYAVCEQFPPLFPQLAAHPLLAAVLGAVFVGVGVGLCVRIGGATGGDDAIAMCLSHALHINIAWVYLVSDALVLGLSLTYIPLQRILWSLLTVVLSGQIIGFVQNFRVKKKKS